MNTSPPAILAFQEKVLNFYREQGRDLPWRRTTDPYCILVSEIMLQQTQVDRVIPYYLRWIEKWPTAADLARTDRVLVLEQWMGLGYNMRALHLHQSAQKIVSTYGGNVLFALKYHKTLPGVGPYTARAVEIFSKNSDLVTVDTNIRRILIHEFGLPDKTPDAQLWALAEKCLPSGRSREWHNALMDYGAMLLTSRKTGIKPKTRQSRFEGSNRQIRARVLRHFLAQKKSFSLPELQKVFSEVEPQRLEKILSGMVLDRLIFLRENEYTLIQT